MTSARAQGFAPVWRPDARLLILGSLPGVASIAATQYYAHPRNQFWPMMQALFQVERSVPYAERLAQLQHAGVALWDLLDSAERPGSLDSAIVTDSMQINDLSALIAQLPQLHTLALNGAKASQLLQRYQKSTPLPAHLRILALPSTSPAHAALNFTQKLQQWQQLLGASNPDVGVVDLSYPCALG